MGISLLAGSFTRLYDVTVFSDSMVDVDLLMFDFCLVADYKFRCSDQIVL